jgi:hypothetical protein
VLQSVATHASGPGGTLPMTPDMLLQWPSGSLFGLSQNVGMGWDPPICCCTCPQSPTMRG